VPVLVWRGLVGSSPRREEGLRGLGFKAVIARGHFTAFAHLPVLEMQIIISICQIRRV